VFTINLTPNVGEDTGLKRALRAVIAMILGVGVVVLAFIFILQAGKKAEFRRFEAGLTKKSESFKPAPLS